MSREYGYIRVSTKEQNLDRQIEAMIATGIKPEFIFQDKQSGKDFERPEYQLVKRLLQPGDTLFVKELDRLGRNADQIKKEWQEIIDKGAYIVVLDMPMLDTRQYKNGMEKVITNIILELLSYIAEMERDKIRKRQAEGIAAAKSQGKHLGRPKVELPAEFSKYYNLWKEEKITATEAYKALKLASTTFYRLVKKYEAGEFSVGKHKKSN
jgi:DNA invertase Pin-like site-specific DNA recombinase